MILLIAIALQAASPDSPALDEGFAARCALLIEESGGRIQRLQAQCPQDAPGSDALQARADAALARVDLPVELGRAPPPDSLEMEVVGGRWDLARTHALVAPGFVTPRNVARAGVNLECAGAAVLTGSGDASDPEFRCIWVTRSGREAVGGRYAYAYENAMREARWIIPLRFEAGCAEHAEAYETTQIDHFVRLGEEDRPNCDAHPFTSVHLNNAPLIPITAASTAYGALCTGRYTYDTEGLVRDASATCQVRDRLGDPVEASQADAVRADYEMNVGAYFARERLPPSATSFDGVRAGAQEIEFAFDR